MAISYDKKIMECVLRSVMSEGNVAQGKAIKSICKSPKPLFITGKGGSGKTTFLKRIIPALKNAVVVAPTGVAAVNAGGQTIHSFFRIGMQPYIPEIRKGALIARAGWNGKGMFVFQRPEDWLSTDIITNDYYDVTETNMIKFCAYLCMKDANDNIVNGWLASQSDMLADDWMVVG